MEDNKNLTVPYIAFESVVASNERKHNKLVAIIIVLIIMVVASNIAWLVAWMQYDYVDVESDEYSVDVNAEGGGNANYIGNDGDINNGEGHGNKEAHEGEE